MSDEPAPVPESSSAPAPDPAPESSPAPAPDPAPESSPAPAPAPVPEPSPASGGAPEAYEAFNLPEGVKLEGEALEKAHAWAKQHNFSQEQAQAVLDEMTRAVGEAHEQANSTSEQARSEQAKEWIDQIKADPVIGGDNFDTTVKHANAAVAQLGKLEAVMGENGQPVMDASGKPQQKNDLAVALRSTGAANNPAVVRALAGLGKLMQEGGYIGGSSRGSNVPAAQKMFAKSNMNP